MKRTISTIGLLTGILFFSSCNKQKTADISPCIPQNNEYKTALELVQKFAEQEEKPFSKSQDIQIKYSDMKTIPLQEAVYSKSPNRNAKNEVNIYTFTLKTNGVEGFAMATGDPRTPQVLAYVENGTLADTIDIPELAFVLRSVEKGLINNLQDFHKTQSIETKNNMEYETINVEPLVKTTWNIGTPYNNSYPNGNCYSGQKYKASSTAIALAQAIVANPKRPNAFPPTYDVKRWTEKKTVEATDFYASQVADLIYGLEGGTNLDCSESFCNLTIAKGMMTYYGYLENESYIFKAGYDFEADLAKSIKQKYCTVVGGQINSFANNRYYAWVLDGFKGKLSKSGKKAVLVQVHCAYSHGGKGNGWFASPFFINGNKNSSISINLEFIHFQPF